MGEALFKDPSGKKLKDSYENPINLQLIHINEKMNPYYHSIGMTPNHLTTLSMMCTFIGLWMYYKAKPKTIWIILGSLLYFVGYYFDCADGNYARTYQLTSKFGDMFDHISDYIKGILTVYVIYKVSPKTTIKPLVITFAIWSIILVINFGCQERLYSKDESPMLNFTKQFCNFGPPTEVMQVTRFFGDGTMQLTIAVLLIWLKWDVK